MDNQSCNINHSGSSDSMETAAAAVEMFSRSVEKRNIKCTTFVGDGDSSCFAHVNEACFNKYGHGYIVVKKECVDQIQKRIGCALREYKRKQKRNQIIRQVFRWPKTINRHNNCSYSKLLWTSYLKNNELESMQNGIWAIFRLVIKDETLSLDEQHKFCPKTPDAGCKFWLDHLNGTNTYF